MGFAAIAEEDSERESSEDEFYHLDTLVTVETHTTPGGTYRQWHDASLFLDEEDSDSDLREQDNTCMVTEESTQLSARLERDLPGLTQAARIPTDEEIAVQADFIGCPQYCKGLGETVKVNGVSVLKGGPFDVTGKRAIVLTWGLHAVRSKPQASSAEEILGMTHDLSDDLQESEYKTLTEYGRETAGIQERYGTPTNTRGSSEHMPCAECIRLREELHTKSVDMHHRCSELMEMVNKESRQQLADLRAAGEKEMQRLRDMLAVSEGDLARAEENLREARSGLNAGKTAHDMAIDRVSSSLAHAIERNSALADSLEHAMASAARERGQCEFYRRTMQSDRLEMKNLQRQLGERQKEEDERVEVYRESCRIAREAVENLRKTTNEREVNNRAEESEHTRDSPVVDRRGKRSRREEGSAEVPEGCEEGRPINSADSQSPPIFDPSVQRSITPIFGQTFGKERQTVEEAEQSVSNEGEGVTESSNASEADEASVTSKKTKKLQRELAKLANANGINVDEYGKQRKERYEAEQEAKKERENLKLLSFVLWESDQSIELRARLRDTEGSIREVDERERGYKAILIGVEGPAEYIKFLNSQLYDVKRPKVTIEWAAELAERYRLHPAEKPKPAKLQMPERDPGELTRWQESIRLIKASGYTKDKERLLVQLQTNAAHSEENEERALRYAKQEKEKKKSVGILLFCSNSPLNGVYINVFSILV